MAWRGTVKKAFTPDTFDAYVKTLRWTDWKPEFLVLHNTAVPSLAQRPDGFTKMHIEWLEQYYRDKQGWSAGPHLFIDDHVIWVFTPLTDQGTHSPSWNRTAIGIEMLGDYNKESFTSGRGLLVRKNAVAAMAPLSNALGFKSDAWKFHVEDKKSDHDCPGKFARAERTNLIREIAERRGFQFPNHPVKLPPWGLIFDDSELLKKD